MLRSRNYILLTFAAVAVSAFAVSGCTPKKAEDNVSAKGNLIVHDCGGEGYVKPVDEKAVWKEPNTASLSLWACLQDRPTKSPMRGHHFEVEDPIEHKRYPVPEVSNDSGCLKWNEPMPFNPFAKKSGHLEIVRNLIDTGLKTSTTVKYYVDPWAMMINDRRDGGKSIQCSERIEAPPDTIPASNQKAQANLLSSDTDGGADLILPKIDVAIMSRQRYGDGQVLELKLTGKPQVTYLDRDNRPQSIPLQNGEFEIFAHLVATDTGPSQNEKMILTAGEMSTYAKVENNFFFTTLRTSLERKTSIGNVTLVVRIVPRKFGGSRPLHDFEGIYELGNIQDFGGGKTGILTRACLEHDADSCNMQKFLKDADNYDRFEKLRIAYKNESLSFSTVKLRFVTIAAFPPETATRRTVTYSASTCVTDRLTGNRMARVPFKLEYVDDKGNPLPDDEDPYQKQNPITDDEGCLRWMAHVTHNYYEVEQFIVKHVRIHMLNSDPVKIEPDQYALPDSKGNQPEKKTVQKESAGTTITFLLNPWDDKFTFGFDKREVSEDFIRETNERVKPPSLFFTGGYGYHTLRFFYDIDQYMNLEVKKTILLEVDPRVLRYSGIVNARRTTENLRDGIYLLKVGIQKSFLDPGEPQIRIYQKPGEQNRAEIYPNREDNPEKAAEVPKREYVTTKTTLVRVVDGRLIKPIELTMRDLRLMRVRANFLIELETIDERLLQVDQALQRQFGLDLKEIQKDRDAFKCKNQEQSEWDYLQKDKNDCSPEIMRQQFDSRRAESEIRLKKVFDSINNMLQRNSNKMSDLEIPQNLLEPLAEALKTNDFTKQKLPDCDTDETHCERFVERDEHGNVGTYLKPRTFVGPVIFLSNAYSDAVRATDNLDEVCRDDNKFLDKYQRARIHNMSVEEYQKAYNATGNADDSPTEDQLYALHREDDKIDSPMESLPRGVQMISKFRRLNKSYIYTPYFNALSHLCYASVDDLILKEQQERKEYEANQPKIAELENFVKTFNMDFAVLNESNAKEYKGDQNRLSMRDVLKEMNEQRTFKLATTVAQSQYGSTEAQDLLVSYDPQKSTSEQDVAMCRLLVNHVMGDPSGPPSTSQLQRESSDHWWTAFWRSTVGANSPIDFYNTFARSLFRRCVEGAKDSDSSVVVDNKLRVFETGPGYTFKGGLQLNLNVGNTFSISRGNSRSGSVEFIDYLDGLIGGAIGGFTGGPAGAIYGAAAGLVVKPFSVKPSSSMGDSEGTSISAQTYLVTQIAKFDVELKQYEKCRIFRLNPNVLGSGISMFDSVVGADAKMKTVDGTKTLGGILNRGIMTCDGVAQTEAIKVPENYYYFTQHFTEGDMLDQADFLNHPWLLSLRGDRDFGNFIRAINAQEDLSWEHYYKGAVGLEPPRPVDWPLKHLANTYRSITPSFPGIYTVLPENERITSAPVNNRIIKIDRDINGEICNLPSRCPELYRGLRSEEQFMNGGGQPMRTLQQ